jgi:MinD superfamily P-loop ATPase
MGATLQLSRLARVRVALALPEISAPKCTACGSCIETCHVEALAIVGDTATVSSPDRCDYCTDCELVCPEGAIACPFELVIED